MSVPEHNVAPVTELHPAPKPVDPHLRPPAWIPDGEYELEGVGYRHEKIFKRDVLIVWWKVAGMDVVLPKYYAVGVKKEGNRKITSARRGSYLVNDFRRLYRGNFRIDRIPVSSFKHDVVFGDVRTVTTDHRQKGHAEGGEYSVVERIWRGTDV